MELGSQFRLIYNRNQAPNFFLCPLEMFFPLAAFSYGLDFLQSCEQYWD